MKIKFLVLCLLIVKIGLPTTYADWNSFKIKMANTSMFRNIGGLGQETKPWDQRFSLRGKKTMERIDWLMNIDSAYRGLAFSPDGKYLASGSLLSFPKIFDVKSLKKGRELIVTELGDSPIYDIAPLVAFSPNGEYLVTSGSPIDKNIKIWDVSKFESRENVPIATLITGDQGRISSIIFSPDGRYLASGSYDATIKIWDMSEFKGKRNITLVTTIKKDSGHMKNLFAFHPSGRYLAIMINNGVEIWDLVQLTEETKEKKKKKKQMTNVPVLRLVTGSPEYLYHLNTSTDIVAFAPDGQHLLASSGGTILIWNLIELQKENKKNKGYFPSMKINAHRSDIRSLVFTPDRKYLISGSADRTIKVWDMSDFTKKDNCALLTLNEHYSDVLLVVVSPDGKSLVSTSFDKTTKFWNIGWHKEPILKKYGL